MDAWYVLVFAISVFELVLVVVIGADVLKIACAEKKLAEMQKNLSDFLARIESNSRVEQNLIDSLGAREIDLKRIMGLVEERTKTLRTLLDLAIGINRSGNFTRERILAFKDKGYSANQIAKLAGTTKDEVSLILAS